MLTHPQLIKMLVQPQSIPLIEYNVSTVNQQTHLAEFPQIDSGLTVLVFKQGDDLIDAINKMMSFVSTVGRQSSFAAGHMARQCPKPKRKRDATWLKYKVLLVEAQGSGKVLNDEELEFLADLGVIEGPVTQMVNTHNAAYQADDLDAYDSDCDDFSTAKAVLMANLYSYGSDVLSEYLLETQNAVVQDINSSAQQDAMILSMFEQLSNHVTNRNKVNKDNLIANESLSVELERYKEREKETKNIDKEIALENKVKEVDNIIRPMLYDGSVIAKETNVISIADSEETLMLEEESRFKMLLKQSDPMVLETKVNIKPIDYAELNRLSEDFGKRFVPQQELSDEQTFRLKNLKYHLGQFDKVVKKRITPDALTEGEWVFEYTKAVFLKEIIPFLKTLKDIFNVFDKYLLNEVTEVQTVFNQMETVVQQFFVDKQCFEILKKQFLIENDRLLDQIISQDIVNIVVNSSLNINTFVNVNSSVAMYDSVNYVEMCNKCLELKAEFIKQYNMVEKDEYNRLSKTFSKLKQHCIPLELAMQINKEIFQKNNTSVNQNEPSFDQLFELNNLKAELQAKDTTIEMLKANIKRLNKTSTTNSVRKDIDEIKTINIELEHKVAKIIVGNEHLKHTYKQLYDLIKPLREKKFVITTLKNDLWKFKGKDIVDNAAQVSNATTITSGMYKLDPVTLAPKDKNNMETHIYYLKHTMEQAAILKEIVKQAKSLNPLDSASYSACNSMFDARHELCILEFVSDMNVSSKSKSVKRAKKKEEWKPTGKVFTKIRYNWRPTRRTFTLVTNTCPLTRITATNKVPLREPIPLELVTQESVVSKVYTRRPKVPKTNGSNRKPTIAKSVISNKTEPGTSRGSNTSVAPSFCGIWTLDAQTT
ncbi:hypothetical protein Tco_0600045 [Tanacetum coccineum]|uniref:Uncharacterized protein n=1 Tax=Tanacetum coccineum TaxID=301880 RepID=A0ABQ4WAP4_9ASTR